MTEQPTPPPRHWVYLDKYCEDTGDTPDRVHARRRKRVWIDGIHCIVAPDGNLRICPEEVNRWIESSLQPSARSSARAA